MFMSIWLFMFVIVFMFTARDIDSDIVEVLESDINYEWIFPISRDLHICILREAPLGYI